MVNVSSLGGTGRVFCLFSSATGDGNFLFLRRGETVNIFSSAERDGKFYIFLYCCKVGAVVIREDSPALLVA